MHVVNPALTIRINPWKQRQVMHLEVFISRWQTMRQRYRFVQIHH